MARKVSLAAAIAKVKADLAFVVHEWDTGHDVMKNGPEQVYDLIINL